jgi:Flp pilus assembly protein TadG
MTARFCRDDRGAFAALELSILSAFAVVMLLLVAGFGRVSRGRELIDHAAAAAARAGSLSLSPTLAAGAARRAAEQTLKTGGLSCSSMQVRLDTSRWYPGGQVTAHLSCRADLSSLAMAGLPGSVTLIADATSPLETYRPIGGDGP